MTPTATYTAFVAAVDRRIRSLRWTMAECDDKSGLQDGFTAKLLHPETASGRQARWETLDLLMQALYPHGFRVTILPLGPPMQALARRPTPPRRAINVPTPEKAREMGIKRWLGIHPKQRERIARRAAKARWAKPRLVEVKNPEGRRVILRALTPSQSR